MTEKGAEEQVLAMERLPNLSLEQEDKIIEMVENCNSLLEQEKGECRFKELIDWVKKRYRDRLIELKREKFM